MSIRRLIATITVMAGSSSILSCGHAAAPTSQLHADPSLVEIDISEDLRPAVDALVGKLSTIATTGAGELRLADLVSIIRMADTEQERLASAYPNPFDVSCTASLCRGSGTGTAVRVPTMVNDSDLAGVELGVRTAVSAGFTVSADRRSALLCDADGVYFARLIFRKNLKAFRISIPEATGGHVTVWLAGADDVPGVPAMTVKTRFALAAVLCAPTVAAAREGMQPGSVLEIGADVSLLEAAVTIGPQSIRTPIARYAEGVWTQGTAITNATVEVAPWPMDGGAGLALTMKSYTHADTHSQTQPRPTILVGFDATIDTWGTTAKQLYLTEDGFRVYPATTQATTTFTLRNLDTSAWGLFWRVRERVAYERAYQELMNRKARQEAQTSLEVSGQLNSTVDQKTADLVTTLNYKYLTQVYRPIIVGGGLAGHTRFATRADRFTIAASDTARPAQPAFSDLTRGMPIHARVRAPLLDSIVKRKLAGQTAHGDELLALIIPGFGDTLGSDPERDAELKTIVASFTATDAASVGIADEELQVGLRLLSLTSAEGTVRNVAVTLTAGVLQEDDMILLDLDRGLRAVGLDGRPLSDAERQLVTHAIRVILPPVQVELSGKVIAAETLPLKIATLALVDDYVDIALARTTAPPRRQGGTDEPSAVTSHPDTLGIPADNAAAWCSAAGGRWVANDAGGVGSCDCKRMWYRSDAILFYGDADFTRRCRADLELN